MYLFQNLKTSLVCRSIFFQFCLFTRHLLNAYLLNVPETGLIYNDIIRSLFKVRPKFIDAS